MRLRSKSVLKACIVLLTCQFSNAAFNELINSAKTLVQRCVLSNQDYNTKMITKQNVEDISKDIGFAKH